MDVPGDGGGMKAYLTLFSIEYRPYELLRQEYPNGEYANLPAFDLEA